MLGARLGTRSNLDMSSVTLSALKENLDASLEIYADVILNPSFPEEDFKRLQQQQLAGIKREKVSPVPMALRDIYEAMQDLGVPKGAALGILVMLGVGMQTYEVKRRGKKLRPTRKARGGREGTRKARTGR